MNPRITDPKLTRDVLGRTLDSSDEIAALNQAGYTDDETSRFGETAIKELIKRATRDGRITGKNLPESRNGVNAMQKNSLWAVSFEGGPAPELILRKFDLIIQSQFLR